MNFEPPEFASAPEPQAVAPVSAAPTFGGYALTEEGVKGEPFLPRAIARAIDLVLHYLLSYFVGSLFGFMLRVASDGRVPYWAAMRLSHLGWPMFLGGTFGYVAYQVTCTAFYGASLGKIMFSLQVVRDDGSPARLVPAFVRELGFFVDSIFFGLVGYMSMQRTIHQKRYGDEWAGTVVTDLSNVPEASRQGTGRFIVGFILGLMADASLLMLGMLVQLNV